ncbi:MAG: BlaI/MecI/CopY family transcriptional regulator [Candidatus Bathyarchaeia archaeon]
MPARKMRIEVFDGDGNKYSIAFEGQVTREKALRLLDLVELLGGVTGVANPGVRAPSSELSKYDKVLTLVQKHFPMVWFSSRDVQAVYEQEFKEPISLSTVATYLSRMAGKGLLSRSGASNRLKYRVSMGFSQVTLEQQVP